MGNRKGLSVMPVSLVRGDVPGGELRAENLTGFLHCQRL